MEEDVQTMSAKHSQQSLQHSKQRKHSTAPRKQSCSMAMRPSTTNLAHKHGAHAPCQHLHPGGETPCSSGTLACCCATVATSDLRDGEHSAGSATSSAALLTHLDGLGLGRGGHRGFGGLHVVEWVSGVVKKCRRRVGRRGRRPEGLYCGKIGRMRSYPGDHCFRALWKPEAPRYI